MLALIDTVIGFTVILLLISFLIKSLTSVVKNHVQYYSQNLRIELKRLLQPLAGASLQRLEQSFSGIDWRNVGEEIFDKDTIEPVLKKLNPKLDLSDLEARIAVHKSALQFAWNKRMKSLSLVCGTALCLLLNINAFTIWTTLYNDVDVRAKFTSEAYVSEVLERANELEEEDPEPAPPPTHAAAADPMGAATADPDEEKEKLAAQRERWLGELESFRQEVDFGIGEIWTRENATLADVLFAIIGSLLTGALASVGAPYLHDLLRSLASVRKKSGERPA